MSSQSRKLAMEIQAAAVLRSAIAELTDDEVAIRDTIEAETSLREMIAAVMADIDEDEILITGIGTMVGRLQERRQRLEERTDARKRAIQRAMEVGEIKTLPTPSGTLSLRAVPRAVEITDEILIPPEYFVPQPPRLDKKKLKDDLKDGKTVPGAHLDNGSMCLSIRRL